MVEAERRGEERTGEDRTGEERRGEGRTGRDRIGEDRTGQDRAGEERRGEEWNQAVSYLRRAKLKLSEELNPNAKSNTSAKRLQFLMSSWRV